MEKRHLIGFFLELTFIKNADEKRFEHWLVASYTMHLFC